MKQYGELSNFKMNPTKSETLTINIAKKDQNTYQKEFLFVWGKKEIKYLGVKIAI